MDRLRLAGVTAFALLAGTGGCALKTSCVGYQCWSPQQQNAWYGATQGSRLIPWDWAMALERPGEPGKFFDGAWLAAKFRLIPRGPGEMPVGLAKDAQDDSHLTVTSLHWAPGQKADAPWLGFNCSACHTAELHYKGTVQRIDGGPGLTDFQSLTEAVQAALVETRGTPAKWDAFARAVLKAQDSPAARTQLGGEVDKLIAWNAKIEAANLTPLRPGFARLDAFGHIYNKVALLAGPTPVAPNPADAPVSYPFLWNTSQADKVQWNGIAKNIKIKIGPNAVDGGALARNAGEVIGVYGDVRVEPDQGLKGYPSSVGVSNLIAFEGVLAQLKPPTWPVAFGALDKAKAARGETLFQQRCGGVCHASVKAGDLTTPFVTNVFTFTGKQFKGDETPGTDPGMACNAFTYSARTANMEGLPPGYLQVVASGDPPMGDTAKNAAMLRTGVVGVMLNRKGEIVAGALKAWLGIPPNLRVTTQVQESKEGRLAQCLKTSDPLLGYRARPLTGIWATAPYLHNGSVPTLYDLLLPPAQRPADFWVGTREYDPVKVGYVTTQSAENSFHFVARDGSGLVPGNGNGGHDYGNASLTDADRWAIIEYLKTL